MLPENWGVNTSERPLGTGRPDVFRRRRRSERVPVDLQARIADSPVIVDVHDLTPEGVAFDSPVPIALGKRVVLLTHLDGVGGIGGANLAVGDRIEAAGQRLWRPRREEGAGLRVERLGVLAEAFIQVEDVALVGTIERGHGGFGESLIRFQAIAKIITPVCGGVVGRYAVRRMSGTAQPL